MNYTNSPIEQITFNKQKYFIKRDDLLDVDFSGNKARKFFYFLKNDFPQIKKIVSSGSAQSNAMYSLSVLCKLKNLEFDYYVDHIASFLKENPSGNYKFALKNKMNIKEEPLPLTFENDTLYINEGGAIKEASYGIDTDDLIESMENRAIKKIFAVDGEAYFRNLEKKTALWLESSVENTIISTGGGFYRQENLKNIGTVIYLKSSFDGILKRIKKAPNAKNKLKKRPLLQNKKEAMKLYDTRVKEYERVADIIVDVENRDLKLIVKEILGQIK
jgi:shikimate kinase